MFSLFFYLKPPDASVLFFTVRVRQCRNNCFQSLFSLPGVFIVYSKNIKKAKMSGSLSQGRSACHVEAHQTRSRCKSHRLRICTAASV